MIECVPATVAVVQQPWTRPPYAHTHVSDMRDLGRRVGEAHGVDRYGRVIVTWEPPVWLPDAPVMSNAWPARMLELL